MLNGEGKEMNRRIAKKLRKEMISWKSVDSPVRHCPSSFRKAWKIDWLLFLTDTGLSQFVNELLLHPKDEMMAAKDAFLVSYTGEKGVNRFTKVQISLAADAALQTYFRSNAQIIESWFNIISPIGKNLAILKDELVTLKSKKWEDINA